MNHTDRKIRLGLIPGLAGESLKQDLEGTLATLRGVGYEAIETSPGLLEGLSLTAAEFAKILNRNGFEAVSWFANWGDYAESLDATLDQARTLGCRYLVWGWAPPDQPEKMAEALPVMQETARAVHEAGFTLLYHNHDHEFRATRDGQSAYDWLLAQFDPDLLKGELDIGWVPYGGGDTLATLRDHPGRFPILHLRDIRDPESRGQFIEVGEGGLDLRAILHEGLTCGGAEFGIVEHTQPLKMDPIAGLVRAAENLKATGLF